MSIEELKAAVEDIETNDLVAGVEQIRDAMLMIVAKIEELERKKS